MWSKLTEMDQNPKTCHREETFAAHVDDRAYLSGCTESPTIKPIIQMSRAVQASAASQ